VDVTNSAAITMEFTAEDKHFINFLSVSEKCEAKDGFLTKDGLW